MAKEKVHCKNCTRLVLYEAKELKKPEVVCPVCGKTTPLEAKAVARYVRTAPRKLRLIADAIRGKKVSEALTLLRFTPKRAAKVMQKVIESAKANAENTYKMDPENLVVSTVFVDGGPVFKRFMPRAMGRAAMVRKRTSHVTVKVRELGSVAVVEEEKKLPTRRTRARVKKSTKPQAPKGAKAPKATRKSLEENKEKHNHGTQS
jgi:large subunit ribosomal protein L22